MSAIYEPYRVAVPRHAEDRLKQRFPKIWIDTDQPVLEKIELEDPAPYELFKESVEVEPTDKEGPAKYHPVHEILFLYAPAGYRTYRLRTVVHASENEINADDMPRCVVCKNITDPRVHDPCPFCQ